MGQQKGAKMKNKIAYFIMAVGLLVLITGSLRYQQGLAQKISLREILKLDPAQSTGSPNIVQRVVSEQREEPGSTLERFPNSVYMTSEQKNTNDEIIAIAKEISAKANLTYLSPGWLHITSQIESFFTESVTLPDGSPVPTKSTSELWVLVGSDGYAVQAVTIDDTGDPRTTQITVFQDGIWSNLSVGMVASEKEMYLPTLDGNFISFAEAYKDILDLETTELEVDGNQLVVFTATQHFQEPMKLAKSPIVIVGAAGKYYFSQATGLLLKTEDYHIYPGDEMKLTRQISLVNIENAETPPAEILAYFE